MNKNKNIIAAVVLVALLVSGLSVTSKSVYRLEKEACFATLEEYAKQLTYEIRSNIAQNQENLERIADIIALYDSIDSEQVKKIITAFDGSGITAELEILLPGDQLLIRGGKTIDTSGYLSFKEEMTLGAHLSGRIHAVLDEEEWILRNFVPILQEGKTTGLLCGVIELAGFEEMYYANAFDGHTEVYMIDTETGDYLLDTWHKTLGNTEELRDREAKSGYSKKKIISDLSRRVSGTSVFFSKTSNEYFYTCYRPVGIRQWMLMLSVPESIAFRQARRVMRNIYYLAAFEIAVILLYFIWLVRMVWKETREKDHQLRSVQYMLEVEKILFEAYRKSENMVMALQKVAEAMKAEHSFLFLIKGEKIFKEYTWSCENHQKAEKQPEGAFADVLVFMEQSGQWTVDAGRTVYNMEAIKEKQPEAYQKLLKMGVSNLLMTIVAGLDEEFTGYLGVCNTEHPREDAKHLEGVSFSFAMAVRNMQVYDTLRRLGNVDSLTGLLNSNSYHAAIAQIGAEDYESLACVYMDANGLHEINNHLGHEEGDRMLRSVADAIRTEFGTGHTYRIGGDEFVAICQNWKKKEVLRGVETVKKTLSNALYDISCGVEWRDTDLNMHAILKAAENTMRQDKRMYYQQKGDRRKNREMNHRVEKIMTEKKDVDAFLSVIAPGFKGVYFVNLSTDTIRHIFIPPYFEEMLAKTEGKFSKAICMYAEKLVQEEYTEAFCQFCDYKGLQHKLNQEIVPELLYERVDGLWMKLKIFKFKVYTEDDRETLWVFEDMERTE